MIDIVAHGHVNACGTCEYICEYCVIVGALTIIVCVTLTREVYKRRIENNEINKKINNLVDIRSF